MLSVCSECGKKTSQPILAASCDGKPYLETGELLCRDCFDRRFEKRLRYGIGSQPEPVRGWRRAQVKFNRLVTA